MAPIAKVIEISNGGARKALRSAKSGNCPTIRESHTRYKNRTIRVTNETDQNIIEATDILLKLY